MTTDRPDVTHTLDVPPVYWADHSRALTESEQPVATKGPRGKVRVIMTTDDLSELRSRAEYVALYWDNDPATFGLKASARATVRAVDQYHAKLAAAASEGNAAMLGEQANEGR